MSLSRKNIIEGVIGSLIATLILFLLGLLISSINIVIVEEPTHGSEKAVEWNFETHPIDIKLPYVTTDVGQEIAKFRVSLNNFFFNIQSNNFGMMFFIGFIWLSVYLTMPSIRWSNIKETYEKNNLRKPTTGRLDYSKIDRKKYNGTYIFNWLFIAYLLVAIIMFVLFRDWFLIFLFSIFIERFFWILTFFIENKQIHNERGILINSGYVILSLPISILFTLIFTLILSYIF